jgi:hypothetical protein
VLDNWYGKVGLYDCSKNSGPNRAGGDAQCLGCVWVCVCVSLPVISRSRAVLSLSRRYQAIVGGASRAVDSRRRRVGDIGGLFKHWDRWTAVVPVQAWAVKRPIKTICYHACIYIMPTSGNPYIVPILFCYVSISGCTLPASLRPIRRCIDPSSPPPSCNCIGAVQMLSYELQGHGTLASLSYSALTLP